MLLRLLIEIFQHPQTGLSTLQALPDSLLLSAIALLIGLTFHEASHALVASALGDQTARKAGRVSLNPLRHLDLLGTLFLLVIGMGWGRPVPIEPANLRFGPMRGMALVGAAGPVMNLLLAFLFALPVRLGILKWHSPLHYLVPFSITTPAGIASDFIGVIVFYNLILCAFNLIPIAPLDGSRLLGFVLPRSALPLLIKFELYGPLVLTPLVLGVLLLDLITGGMRLLEGILPLANLLSLAAVGKPLS